jgi:hypothetical protein
MDTQTLTAKRQLEQIEEQVVTGWLRGVTSTLEPIIIVLAVYLALYLLGLAQAQGANLSSITADITAAGNEVRTGMFPAIAGIIGAMVLIGVAAGVARVLTRSS